MPRRACWCGNSALAPWGAGYGECKDCGTLVNLLDLPDDRFEVVDDEKDFYGRRYWLAHQDLDFGYPGIEERARADLAERNLHWLRALLRYRLPPARVVELGCAHASFVALMQAAGYDASGVEMSPWVVAFGRETFGVPVSVGPIESLGLPEGSLDVIALMDVLEHLPDPAATMRHCLRLLSADGFLLVQTPRFRPGTLHEDLVRTSDRFLEHVKPDEHVYMFSEVSLARFFSAVGAAHVAFEPAMFADYDMFAVASRTPVVPLAREQGEAALLSRPQGRLVLGLLALRDEVLEATRLYLEADADRTARADQVERLATTLQQAEEDRRARLGQVEALTAQLLECEEDRAARLREIESLAARVQALQVDCAGSAEQLRRAIGEHAEVLRQIEALAAKLEAVDRDRSARLAQIETLTVLLKEADADRKARLEQVETLKGLLEKADADRRARLEQVETLTGQLRTSDDDRASRLRALETLGVQLRASEEDRARRGTELAKAAAACQDLLAQVEALAARAEASESKQVATLLRVRELHASVQEIEQDRASALARIAVLEQELSAQRRHYDALRADVGELLERRDVRVLARLSRKPGIRRLLSGASGDE